MNRDFAEEWLNKLKEYFNNPIFIQALSNTNIFRFSFKNILKYIMMKMKLYILVYNIIVFKERKISNE